MKRHVYLLLPASLLIVALTSLHSFRPWGSSLTTEVNELKRQHAALDFSRMAGIPDLVLEPVDGGTFTMGATSEQQNPDSDERPAHRVTLGDYYIGRFEVTQALWQHVMGENPSDNKSNSRNPVESVSWDDCQRFISRLNQMTGQRFRLPTEAEWEYAARGGNKSRGYQYSGSNNIWDVAWYDGNSGNQTHVVGTKQANELGLYDMSGNVWEWCQDWYGSYSSNAQTNPQGPTSGSYRVIRGGGRWRVAGYCRVANRIWFSPGDRLYDLGFRLAL